ncbi:MAG: SelB C-terminal domain-containing protein, partial [Gaiellaceae bacterium]
VRSVQVHDREVERAEAGQRVAVSLPGVERAALRRGDALVEPKAYALSYRLDVALDELEPIPDGARLNVHHGTAQIPARLVLAGEGYAQLRLAAPVVARRGDRVVLRAGTTIGGGVVLDPAPARRLDARRLRLLEAGDARAVVSEPVLAAELEARGLSPAGLERAGEWVFAAGWLDDLRSNVKDRLAARAASEPLDPGLSLPELLPPAPWVPAIVPLLEVERRGGKAYLPGTAASLGDRAAAAERLERDLAEAGLAPVRVDDRQLAAFLEQEGRLVRVGDGLALGVAAYDEARRALVDECERAGRITLARFRDLLGASRRSAQLLLERFDADGLTRRIGDERVLRRRAARGV